MNDVNHAEPILLPVAAIEVDPDHNPRRHFEPTAFARLVDSVRDNGIISAIAVRRVITDGAERFLLIAGERRLRASRQVGLEKIPATVWDVNASEARTLALLENIDRADLSVAEEALAARRIVDDCSGDLEEAAAVLGWSDKKLARRLLLLHASKATLDALNRSEIPVQVAELLASIPAEKQDLALPKIVELQLTVQQVREQIIGITTPLSSAKFDVSGCAGCAHNSDVQASLFEAHVGAGRCSNRACFNTKSQEWIALRKVQLEEEYAQVALVTQTEPGRTVPLLMLGEGGVGSEAFGACKGCARFGALLDDRSGANLGSVLAPTCFDVGCNATKQAEYAQACGKPAPASDANATPAALAPVPRVKASPGGKAVKGKPTSSAPQITAAVAGHYDATLRNAAAAALLGPERSPVLALAVYGLATVVANATGRQVSTVLGDVGLKAGDGFKHTSTVLALSEMDAAALSRSMEQVALLLFAEVGDSGAGRDGRVDRRQLAAAWVRERGWDMQAHVRVDTAFLESHTKSAIESLLGESGFQAAREAEEGGAKRYKALLGEGKATLVRQVVESGFDFGAYTPAALIAHADELASAARR